MYMNPNLMEQLAKDHEHHLLREAEAERLATLARMERPPRLMRLRLLASELLSRMGRRGQPSLPDNRETPGALTGVYRRGPASAHIA